MKRCSKYKKQSRTEQIRIRCSVGAWVLTFSTISFSAYGQTIAEQQASQVDKILVDMNQSSKEVADTVISNPQKAIDAGCLDGINSIDLSVMTIDWTSTWLAIYLALKDKLMNGICNAAEDWANKQTSMLDEKLEAPIGLGNISVTQGSAIKDWQSVQKTDVELSNQELATKVSTEALGNVPSPVIHNTNNTKASSNKDSPSSDKSKWEEKAEERLNMKSLWE